MEKLFFASDYQEGAHPSILKRLEETNLMKTAGYGADAFCAAAREKVENAHAEAARETESGGIDA